MLLNKLKLSVIIQAIPLVLIYKFQIVNSKSQIISNDQSACGGRNKEWVAELID